MPRLVRDYYITNGGDIKVIHDPNGAGQDISEHYQNIAPDLKHRRVEAILQVMLEDDGLLSLRQFRNGISDDTKASIDLLLEMWLVDTLVTTAAPRKL